MDGFHFALPFVIGNEENGFLQSRCKNLRDRAGIEFPGKPRYEAVMKPFPRIFLMACVLCVLTRAAECVAEVPKNVLSENIATLERAYENSGFLKSHPDFKITKDDNSLTLTFHAREWLVYGCGMDGKWAKDPGKETGPDSDGMIITVWFDDNEVEQWAGRHNELNLKGGDLSRIKEPYWQSYGCGAQLSNSRIYVRVNIATNNRTERKLIEEAFGPIAVAFGTAKEK